MKVYKKLALALSVVMILLTFVQPIFAFASEKGNGKYHKGSIDDSSIKSEDKQHEDTKEESDKEGEDHKGSGKGSKSEGKTNHGGSNKSGNGNSKGSGEGNGSKDGSKDSGGGKPPVVGTSIPLYVTVEWPKEVNHPNEVDVTLVGTDSSTTIKTVDSKATFNAKPGDEWKLNGEAIPGFTIPEKGVEIKGTDKEVKATLIYEKANQLVEKIELNKTKIEIFAGDSVKLIATIIPKNANEQDVEWESSSTDIATINNGVVTAIAPGNVTITARSKDSAGVEATCSVTVNPAQSAVRVTGVTLDKNSLNLNLGENNIYQLIATIAPDGATVKDVLWSSSDNSVATVDESGLVTAKSTGFAVITVETVDLGFKAYAQVSVVSAPEITYIFPCLVDNDNVEHFEKPEDVYINVVNLVEKLKSEGLPENGITYYVKVTEKGSSEPLGEGTVTINKDTKKFWLFEKTNFKKTDNFSNRYFVYMSQFKDYPKDDEKTLKTSFMGGSATPTIPVENVKVNVVMYGGSKSRQGIIFLLTREELFGKTLEEVSWRDFYNGKSPDDPYPANGIGGADVTHFVDEVKMVGVSNAQGVVEWIEPRETLKLGGYLLLEVTPLDYMDNLNMQNPVSDDGDLLKQVSLKRDGGIDVKVTNVYTGEQHTDNPNEGDPGKEDPGQGNNDTDNPKQPTTDKTKSNTNVIDEAKIELVSLEDLEKFNSHWSKKYMDNLTRRGKLSKNTFNKITDINDDVYLNDVIELIKFIHGKKYNEDLSIVENQAGQILITRQQAIVMITSSFGIKPVDNPKLDFIDSNEIDENAKGYIAKAKELGIISGYPDNTFRPNLTLTKAELFTMISKCLDFIE